MKWLRDIFRTAGQSCFRAHHPWNDIHSSWSEPLLAFPWACYGRPCIPAAYGTIQLEFGVLVVIEIPNLPVRLLWQRAHSVPKLRCARLPFCGRCNNPTCILELQA